MKKIKILWLCLLSLFWFIWFSSADFTWSYYCPSSCNFTFNIFDRNNAVKLTDVALSNNFWNMSLRVYYSDRANWSTRYQKDLGVATFDTTVPCSQTVESYCVQILQIVAYWCYWNSCTINSVYTPNSTCPECETCPEINTWEILSWYILESEIDQSYCIWNWFCPEINTGDYLSQLFINNVMHQSASVINIDISDWVYWDYTWNDQVFYMSVWTWFDDDYIEWIINVNSYRPTSEDFTQSFVGGLTLIIPYIVIVLFIVFIWKFIKRVFKS